MAARDDPGIEEWVSPAETPQFDTAVLRGSGLLRVKGTR